MSSRFADPDIRATLAAAAVARRKNIARLYVVDLKSIAHIAQQVGIACERVRQALIREGVTRLFTNGKDTVRKPQKLIRTKFNPLSEYSKDGKARSSGADPSKKPLMKWAEQDALYRRCGNYSAHDHPNPIAGLPVSIHPRAAFAFHGSGMGCAADMCAAGGDALRWGR